MKNIIIALALTFLVIIGIQLLFAYALPGFLVVVVYLLLYCLIQRVRRSKQSPVFPNDAAPDRSAWPLPGPLSRASPTVGGILFMTLFWVTNLASLLNPFQLAQIIRQLIGNERMKAREKRTGDNYTEYQAKTSYCLPFRGDWLVVNGGMTPKTSHSWDILGQRFALDFVQADDQFCRHVGAGTRLDDYHCYRQPIHAAADGTVVSVENRISDAPFVGFGICDFVARNFFGNYVIF
jgi:hypothetical protein